MSLGLLFWILFVLWIVLCYAPWPPGNQWCSLLLVALMFIVGWKLFGFIVQGG